MENKHLITAVAALAALGAVASSGAVFATATASTAIPIVNPDFNVVLESQGSSVTGTLAGYSTGWGATTFSSSINYTDGSSSTSGYVPGWTGAGGEQVLGSTTTAPNPRSGGSYACNSYGATTQTLSANVMPNTTYLLTLGADIRYSGSYPYWYLTAEGTQISGGLYIGNPAGYQQAPNTVAELVTTGATASGALGIALGNNGGGQTLFNYLLAGHRCRVQWPWGRSKRRLRGWPIGHVYTGRCDEPVRRNSHHQHPDAIRHLRCIANTRKRRS